MVDPASFIYHDLCSEFARLVGDAEARIVGEDVRDVQPISELLYPDQVGMVERIAEAKGVTVSDAPLPTKGGIVPGRWTIHRLPSGLLHYEFRQMGPACEIIPRESPYRRLPRGEFLRQVRWAMAGGAYNGAHAQARRR